MNRARIVLVILIASAFFCGLMAAATAQQPHPREGCGPLEPYLQYLKQAFNEFRVLDLEFKGGKFVVTRSNEGTWTILSVEGQDAACVFAAGKSSIVDRGV